MKKKGTKNVFKTNLCISVLDESVPEVPVHKCHATCFHFLAVILISALQFPISQLKQHLQISDPHLTG
jgi:hypothetical protein